MIRKHKPQIHYFDKYFDVWSDFDCFVRLCGHVLPKKMRLFAINNLRNINRSNLPTKVKPNAHIYLLINMVLKNI